MVREASPNREQVAMQDCFMCKRGKRTMSVNEFNALPEDNVAQVGQKRKEVGKGGRRNESCEGYVINFK